MKLERLSKEISYALRHAPWEYGLELDVDGWVTIDDLLKALKRKEPWKGITITDLEEMIEMSSKKRHEIKNNKIRALYGHSIPTKIIKEKQQPPDVLYHGTARESLDSIMQSGLLPQKRQYVHLSQDVETAINVGKRHTDNPRILIIDAKKAWEDGVAFYYGNAKVWLADAVPSCYIQSDQVTVL